MALAVEIENEVLVVAAEAVVINVVGAVVDELLDVFEVVLSDNVVDVADVIVAEVVDAEVIVPEVVVVVDEVIPDDELTRLLYIFRCEEPPQYSSGLPKQVIVHPEAASTAVGSTVFPQ